MTGYQERVVKATRSPFDDVIDSIDQGSLKSFTQKIEVSDLTEENGLTEDVIRVCLRRLRQPASKKVKRQSQLLGEEKIIGFITPSDMPKKGEEFKMYYHKLNDVQTSGWCGFPGTVTEVTNEDNLIYFDSSEGSFRLEILDSGN